MKGNNDVGRECGAEWAKAVGVRELRAIARRVEAEGGVEHMVRVANNGSNHGSGTAIYAALFDDPRPLDTDYQDFWENVVALDREWSMLPNNDHFARGFVEGVLSRVAVPA